MTKNDLLYIKYNRLIEDPFSDLTEEASYLNMYNQICGFFGKKKKVDKSHYPSIWAAYRKGYEQAYSEILAGLRNE